MSGRSSSRLRDTTAAGDQNRIETILATARLFLAIAAIVAFYVDPTFPVRYVDLSFTLLGTYVALCGTILVLTKIRPARMRSFATVVHVLDVVWPSIITLFTQGPSSPFFVFFVFAVVAAAYRWGMRETLWTTGACLVIVLGEAALLAGGTFAEDLTVEGAFEINRLIVRGAYLATIGGLIGYLAEGEKLIRSETAVIARVLARIRAETGIQRAAQAVLDEVDSLFEGRAAAFALDDSESNRTFLWPDTSGRTPGARAPSVFFPAPAACYARLGENGSKMLTVLALDENGRSSDCAGFVLPPELTTIHHPRSLICVTNESSEARRVRLLVFDPADSRLSESELRFLQLLVQRVAPAIESIVLLDHLRAQAGAAERAQIAREIHDGSIQSLIALEMRFEVLRRQARGSSALANEVTDLQEILRQEVATLRDIVQRMRPIEVDPARLSEYLGNMAERFERETGIDTRFVSTGENGGMPRRTAREIARIVQEALVNVRKHSGAKHALVNLCSSNDGWKLVIEDDGRGFAFSGRHTAAELSGRHQAPAVLSERSQAIGAQMTIESTPGTGTRLEMTIPRRETGHGD